MAAWDDGCKHVASPRRAQALSLMDAALNLMDLFADGRLFKGVRTLAVLPPN